MDVIVRMTVEIGVDAIHPVITTRSEVRLSTERRRAKVERWRRIARSAAEQSHRQRVPELGEPAPLADVIKALGPTAHIITLSEREKGATLRHVLNDLETPSSSLDVALVVGPEGGLSVEEEYALSDAGALTATLGETILRTETAAVVAVALANDIRGGTD
jgi:16S rRNA (uracil1498-N3)-methyltransferase